VAVAVWVRVRPERVVSYALPEVQSPTDFLLELDGIDAIPEPTKGLMP
jgi:hypothetical protein